ncbi:NAD-dependent epimerase/dehydratase family protein [Phaeacidiphilus oryzae]|uniref:NAD-dependent epimerase/dehydratase family protein n=1 Tax=Phaeacidiphilus oryzae TaxID=348818 RepID=UPI00056A09B9|nr:NAD-dependent epimerase/dehydratase family protein [Phaeacidiphilus oryzae]
MGKVLLVTGVARQFGGRFVRRVRREPGVDLVVGVDLHPPAPELVGPEGGAVDRAAYAFARADIRRPVIGRLLAEYGVDTVVHLGVSATLLGSAGRSQVKETNVIGSMQLLGAVQKAPSVRRLVVKSTTSVYGSAPRDPAVFDEQMQPKTLPSGGFAKDAVEVEGYVRGFARRRPDVAVTVLRFANIIGPRADTPLAEYLSFPVLPTVLGYDPRLQLVHEQDAVEAVRLAAFEAAGGSINTGTFNIAGEGVLLLSQAARRLGRPTVPVLPPAVSLLARMLRGSGLADFSPEQMRLLTHGRVVDTTQMRDTFGFTPEFSTGEALDDFARVRGRGLLPPERVEGLVDRIGGGLLRLPPTSATRRTP